jgi:hypothetical protein
MPRSTASPSRHKDSRHELECGQPSTCIWKDLPILFCSSRHGSFWARKVYVHKVMEWFCMKVVGCHPPTLLLTSDEFFLAFHPSLVFRMETPIVGTALDGSGSAGFRFYVSCFSRWNDEAYVGLTMTESAGIFGADVIHDSEKTVSSFSYAKTMCHTCSNLCFVFVAGAHRCAPR